MITHLAISDNFNAVPYLKGSALIQHHPEGIEFSLDKPNVIIGQNGAGKSALLTALSLKTLTHFTGESSFDDNFFRHQEADAYWTQKGYGWSKDFAYLDGLECETDHAPALFYRPSHLPGNDVSVTHSMMMGYFERAKQHGKLIDEKSSGQQCLALLDKVYALLDGKTKTLEYQYINWHYGKAIKELDRHASEYDHKANLLKTRYGSIPATARPMLIMDEPEQSLDALAEVNLWQKIARANTHRLQIVVASHSLYPLLHPEKFHLIEARPGYIKEVQSLITA